MYQVGQCVAYSSHGVCTVMEIETKIVDKKPMQFYALAPISQPVTRYYVPMHNAVAMSKIRELLSADAWRTLLKNTAVKAELWIPDENRRKLAYRELINRGNPAELADMVRLLLQHRCMQSELGKKFHVCDAAFLQEAVNLLLSEAAYVLGSDAEELSLLKGL